MKYLILDFGMVLAYPTTGNWFITPIFKELIKEYDINKFNESIRKYGYLLDLKLETLEEEYEMIKEFYSNVLKDQSIIVSNEIIETIATDFVYEDNKYGFYEGIKEELELLSKKYTLLMLTDNWPCVIPILEKHNLTKYFDKIYVSSIYDCKKEQGTFFDYPIKEYDIKKDEALFIDDNESLLSIGQTKGLKVLQMNREKNITTSKHKIINNLNEI